MSVANFVNALLAGCADELARLDARMQDLLRESNPATANELIAEYELELGLPSSGSTAERLARIVAQETADAGFRPEDIQTALAPLLALNPVDVIVIERTHADAVAMGDDREIFRFFVYRAPDLTTYYVASAQALLDKIKPSHTLGYVIESINFLCDDPYSLCDRDLLGA